jgi:hypothetical protein
MKTYRVLASYISYCETTIEAETEEEAHEIAKKMSGGFDSKGYGDWNIDEIVEIEECKQE